MAETIREAPRSSTSSSNKIMSSTETETREDNPPKAASKDWRFWTVLVAISLASLLTALEATITSTALPSIVGDLGGGHLYVWAVNGYLLVT